MTAWLWYLLPVVGCGLMMYFMMNMSMGGDGGRATTDRPLDLLQKRYASGEITTEEFEERRRRLEPDDATRTQSSDVPKVGGDRRATVYPPAHSGKQHARTLHP